MSLSDLNRRRQRSFSVEAVVLRHSDWGEADRLLWLFTLEHGKMRAVAKGVRKLRSRKAGHLEPFTRSKLLLAQGRDFYLVTQAETLSAFLPLHEDLSGVTYASYVVELLDRFTYEEGENRQLYLLLVETLDRLRSSEEDRDLVARYYEMRLLDLVGFRPQLFQCVSCGAEIRAEDQFFSAHLGGVLCPRCGPGVAGAQPVAMETLKYLRHFQRSRFAEARRAVLNPGLTHQLELVMQHYITYLLERGLNTPAFLRRLRKDIAA
jgi:DNA repair protein RecO (recombination protein O)